MGGNTYTSPMPAEHQNTTFESGRFVQNVLLYIASKSELGSHFSNHFSLRNISHFKG